MTREDREDYQPQFDGLRALAVLTVIVDHFAADVPNFPLPDSIHLGATGVRLFLVLSGFFITASLRRARARVDAGQVSATRACGTFYERRFVRLLPPYLLFVALGAILNLGVMRESLGWLLTGTVNFFIAWHGDWPVAVSQLWSICVQEQFYLCWPLLILFLPRRWILPAIFAAGVAGIVFRVGCVVFDVPVITRWVLPFGSLDSLAAGALLGWQRWRLPASRLGQSAVALGCAALLVTAAILRNLDPTRMISVLVEPCEAIALTCLVAKTAVGFEGLLRRALTFPGLLYAGRVSYGIYIYHVLVAMCFHRWLPAWCRWLIDVPPVRLVTLTAATLGCAALSWHWLEKPLKRVRFRRALPT